MDTSPPGATTLELAASQQLSLYHWSLLLVHSLFLFYFGSSPFSSFESYSILSAFFLVFIYFFNPFRVLRLSSFYLPISFSHSLTFLHLFISFHLLSIGIRNMFAAFLLFLIPFTLFSFYTSRIFTCSPYFLFSLP